MNEPPADTGAHVDDVEEGRFAGGRRRVFAEARGAWWLAPVALMVGLGFLVAWLAGAFEADTVSLADHVSREFSIAPGDSPVIVVHNVSGGITVERGDAGRVVVRVIRTGRGATDDAAFASLTALQLRMSAEGGRVLVTTSIEGTIAGGAATADIRIIAPAESAVELEAVAGKVRVSGLDGVNCVSGRSICIGP